MTNKIVDTTFGLNNQALAVLYFLDRYKADFIPEDEEYKISLQTCPWYNGREKGFCISMGHYIKNNWLHIAVFEYRNTDNLCALKWETTSPYWNLATIEEAGKVAYADDSSNPTISFGYGEIGKCAKWIYDALKEYYSAKLK